MPEATLAALIVIAQTVAALAGWHVGSRTNRQVTGLWAGAVLGLLEVLVVSLLSERAPEVDYTRRDGPGM